MKRVVINHRYTYETDLPVRINDTVILPGKHAAAEWKGQVTALESEYDGPCAQVIGFAFEQGVLYPIETAPKDGRYILLYGDSGYVTTPLRAEICHYDAEFRPLQPWVNHSGDSFMDGGAAPLWWSLIPVLEE